VSDITLSVLLPVRDEGVSLRVMLKMLRGMFEVPNEILVVYDKPDDDSIPVVEEIARNAPNVRGVLNTSGPGVAGAIRAGVAAARGSYVLIFAADDVGPVLAIEDMISLMERGCDFVSCTRYAHGGRRLGGSIIGGMLSRLANRMFTFLAGSGLTDATTGVKMFRRELFSQLDLTSRPVGWAVAFEMSMKAQLAGFRLGEVPIISVDRLYGGTSTFKVGPWVIEYLRWFVWGAIHLRRMPPQSPVVQRPTAFGPDARA
jgi:dolichol-phosphate mannosyltransferase